MQWYHLYKAIVSHLKRTGRNKRHSRLPYPLIICTNSVPVLHTKLVGT